MLHEVAPSVSPTGRVPLAALPTPRGLRPAGRGNVDDHGRVQTGAGSMTKSLVELDVLVDGELARMSEERRTSLGRLFVPPVLCETPSRCPVAARAWPHREHRARPARRARTGRAPRTPGAPKASRLRSPHPPSRNVDALRGLPGSPSRSRRDPGVPLVQREHRGARRLGESLRGRRRRGRRAQGRQPPRGAQPRPVRAQSPAAVGLTPVEVVDSWFTALRASDASGRCRS